MARFRQACGRPELASEEENHVKITWTNVRHAVEAVRRMAEEGLAGLLCPKCCERLELRGDSFCPLGFSGGSITSFSIGELNLSLRCQKCQAQQPLPANVKKELANRLTVQAKNRKKDQNGEAES